jgi:hypothetical protein
MRTYAIAMILGVFAVACSGASADERSAGLENTGAASSSEHGDDADAPQNLRGALTSLDEIASRSVKMHVDALSDVTGQINGVRTSVNLLNRVPGFSYEHDFGASAPGNPDQPILRVASVPGNPDLGASAPGNPDRVAINALFIGNPNLIGNPDFVGNPDLFGGFSLGVAASNALSPYVTVTTAAGNQDRGAIAPGNPDLTLRVAIGNPGLLPANGRVRVDLGPSNSFDLVRTFGTTGGSTVELVPAVLPASTPLDALAGAHTSATMASTRLEQLQQSWIVPGNPDLPATRAALDALAADAQHTLDLVNALSATLPR